MNGPLKGLDIYVTKAGMMLAMDKSCTLLELREQVT